MHWNTFKQDNYSTVGGDRGSSAGSYLADPTSPIPSRCALIVVTSTLRVNGSITYSDMDMEGQGH